jgi:hypothetical protein
MLYYLRKGRSFTERTIKKNYFIYVKYIYYKYKNVIFIIININKFLLGFQREIADPS